MLRLLDSTESNRPAYNLLCHELGLLDQSAAAATRGQALAFRLKLLLAAGFAPELASCAACGEAEHLGGFSPSAGGVVCASCEAGSFPLSEDAHRFLVTALAKPLAEAPEAPEPALAQADRAIAETLEYHAHVRLARVSLGHTVGVKAAAGTSSSTTSPRDRARCASCSAARAPTSRR